MTVLQPHCGYYVYKGEPLSDRAALLDAMLANQDWDPDPAFFVYNDDVYSRFDWRIEPTQTLKQLYVERAQQLRDQYKYLILSYSGGSDSTEVLETFLEAGIFIDEIQTVHYDKIISRLDADMVRSDDSLAVLFEYQAAVLPKLQRVKQLSPNTKITTLDTSDYAHAQIAGKKFAYMGMNGGATNGAQLIKPARIYNYYMHTRNHQALAHKDGVAFIRGGEKPLVFVTEDDRLEFRFNDIPMHGTKLMRAGQVDPLYTFEDFFWSPNAPLIPIKQAHIIKKCIEYSQKLYHFVIHGQQKTLNEHQHENPHEIDRIWSPIIYHHSKSIDFIAPKPKQNPEILLISTVDPSFSKDYSKDLVQEKLGYYLEKYKQINRAPQIAGRNWLSRPYNLGKLRFHFQPNTVWRVDPPNRRA